MKLVPYERRSLRWKKVVKHVFDKRERWWEITGDFPGWSRDWNLLRAHGALDEPEGYLVCGREQPPLEVVGRNHERWHGAAEVACDEARDAGRVYPTPEPGKACYVGERGVTVYVARGEHLATCFRPRRSVGVRLSMDESTRRADQRARAMVPAGWDLRRAQRDATRRADLVAAARGGDQ